MDAMILAPDAMCIDDWQTHTGVVMSASAQAVSQTSGDTEQQSDNAAHRSALLSTIKHQAQAFVVERLQDCQLKADDTLFELAGNTKDEDLHYLYLDTISRLRNQRQLIKESFLSRYKELYESVLENIDPGAICFTADAAAIDKLLLNGDDDLESMVAIKNLATRIAEQNAAPLQTITQMFKVLSGKALNPLHPVVLCIAWKNAVDKAQLSVKARFVVYKLFAKFVLCELPVFYKTTLAQAAHLGIDTHPPAESKQKAPAAAAQDQISAKTNIGKDINVEQVSRDLIMKRVVELLRNSAANGAPKEKRTQGIIEALAILQEYQLTMTSTPAASINPASYLTGIFARILNAARCDCPDQNDLDTVDLVNVLVDGIAGDTRLDERTRTLAGALRLTLLKLAYLDPSFLTDAAQSGRRLLQGLFDAASIAATVNDEEQDRVYAMSKQIVDRVLLEFRHDVATIDRIVETTPLFARDTGTLTKIADTKAEIFNLIESRLSRKMQHRAAPDAIRDFLATTWTNALHHIRDTKGTDDEAWKNGMQCVDDLAAIALAQQTPAPNYAHLLEIIPRLLCSLQNGLSLVSYDRKKKEQLFNQILSVHARAIQSSKQRVNLTKKSRLTHTATA